MEILLLIVKQLLQDRNHNKNSEYWTIRIAALTTHLRNRIFYVMRQKQNGRTQRFFALNGVPIFKFNEAISFQVYCQTQEEVDYYWENLSQGDRI